MMKKLLFPFVFLSLLLTVGCSGKPGPVPVPASEREISLSMQDSSLVLEARDEAIVFTSFSSAGKGNVLGKESVFALPQAIGTEEEKTVLEWRYSGWEKVSGTEAGIPFEGARMTYTDEARQLRLDVTVLSRPSLQGPFEFRSTVTNLSPDRVLFRPGKFASVSVDYGGEVVLIRKESGYAEGIPNSYGYFTEGTGIYRYEDEVADADAWVNTSVDFNTSGCLPMIYQDKGDCGVYCALEWTSGRVVARGYGEALRLSVDMDDIERSNPGFTRTFSTWIEGGSVFELPNVYLGVYDGTLDDGSNAFKHWFFACKAPEKLREDEKEPLTQMNYDFKIGLDTHGIESVKWDYGWWSADPLGIWQSLEGSWQIRNPDYFFNLSSLDCGTMAEFGQKVRDRGLNWTVYLLLHDTLEAVNGIGVATDAYGEFNSVTHPEWFSGRITGQGMGSSADLGNEECVEFLKKALTDFFLDNRIGTWRSDFEPICLSSARENRHQANGPDVMYWCTVGFRDIIRHLYENVPDFRYESCSCGGSMKDLLTATLAVSINTDDLVNILSMRATFYDGTYVLHPAQLQFPCDSDIFNPDCGRFWTTDPDPGLSGAEYRKAMLDMGFRTQCLGSPMYCTWTGTWPTDYIETYSALYDEKMRPLIREGELYHILPRPDGIHYDGVMYADPDSERELKGLVYLFKPSSEAGDRCHLTLAGLDPNKTYRLTFEDRPEQNTEGTGAFLMTEGLDVEILFVGSELIWITEKD